MLYILREMNEWAMWSGSCLSVAASSHPLSSAHLLEWWCALLGDSVCVYYTVHTPALQEIVIKWKYKICVCVSEENVLEQTDTMIIVKWYFSDIHVQVQNMAGVYHSSPRNNDWRLHLDQLAAKVHLLAMMDNFTFIKYKNINIIHVYTVANFAEHSTVWRHLRKNIIVI